MKILIYFALLTLAVAAPKGKGLSFKNLYKNPDHEVEIKLSPHIIGGQEAKPHSVPAQAFLEMYTNSSGWYCGGSLISENYILTAGHCGDGASKAVVILGAHQLSVASDAEIIIESDKIVVHPDYDGDLIINDIAVIQLPEAVNLTDAIAPIALTNDIDNDYVDKTARISGWGLTNGFHQSLSDTLNYVDVRVISNEECEQDFSNVSSSIVCTSGNEKTGSCSGDSGGPLIYNGTQIGIVSFGMLYCLPGYASAFTRVTSFLDWIAENTDVQLQL